MFRELVNFASVRSAKDAFVFYCTYFLLIILIVTALSRTIQPFLPEITVGQYVSILTTLVVCEFLVYRILATKGLADNFNLYFFLAVTATLAILGGPLLGMIPVAHLATKNLAIDVSVPPSPAQDLTDAEIKT